MEITVSDPPSFNYFSLPFISICASGFCFCVPPLSNILIESWSKTKSNPSRRLQTPLLPQMRLWQLCPQHQPGPAASIYLQLRKEQVGKHLLSSTWKDLISSVPAFYPVSGREGHDLQACYMSIGGELENGM